MSAFHPMLNEIYHKERLQDLQRSQQIQRHAANTQPGAPLPRLRSVFRSLSARRLRQIPVRDARQGHPQQQGR
ncbi:MAG: hypothetical protein ACOC9C_02425 [Chloroflexota bacterium]